MASPTRFVELKKLYDVLHGPKGCMWDKEQTHLSILPSLREEVEEFIRATRRRNCDEMKEELGDVLLHVLFHARIAQKNGTFDIEDVISCLIAKLKRRHPHVFAGRKVSGVRQIIRNWHEIKKKEKAAAVRCND